jgi:RNA polymerase sigma-70 factor (ECF subfamily)
MTEAAGEDYASDERRWAALMVSAQTGHEADYRLLLTEVSKVIHQYLCSRFGHHDYIEDCVQETLVAIHQARHTYDSGRLFRPWMFAIVRNKAIDNLRRQRSHHHALERHREALLLNTEGTDTGHLENGVVRGRLIDALSPQHREAITLTKINGLSTAEAAAHLSISEGALKVRVHRAIGRLKRLVQADTL